MNNKQRLLDIITPIEYDILLKPDLREFTFTGEETLTFEIKTPSKVIALHAKNLEITKAVLLRDNTEHVAEISYNKKNMSVVLTFAHAVEKGKHILQLTFTGKIGDQLKGWYKSAYSVNGEKRHMATTQFEEIGAREVFPSIDDPMAKAIFHISLTIPSQLIAISNTIDTKVLEHENGYKTVTFAPTPRMATYALACIVGEFEYIEATTATGVKVRVFVTPGKKSQAKFALDTCLKLLPFYEEYFDIKYPLPVLDLIAIPDFDAGAMENWGAITAREVALLVDDQETSSANKQWVAIVIAHELTHMWFGNLVTMKWWDDLWLNEGFASYMEYVGVHTFFPQWKMWEQFAVLDHNRAMGLDSLESTHPIESPVTDIEKISQMFDEVSYSKGACVIQMIAGYVGEKNFRDGLRYYLKKHQYNNATTDDLWGALENVSGKKIKHIMQQYTQQPGHPVISVSSTKNSLQLSQSRFYSNALSRKKSKNTTIWAIPLINKTEQQEEELLLDKKEIKMPAVSDWIKINSGETSFARTIYSEDLYEKLKNPIQKKLLSSIDRMGILRDAFDSAESGYLSIVAPLRLLEQYKSETAYIVWASLLGKLGKIENLLDSREAEEQFASYARSILVRLGEKVGWEKRPTDTHEDILLRSMTLSALGMYKDKKVIDQAKTLFEKVAKDKKSVDTDVRGVVYALAAENACLPSGIGGEKEFEMLRKMYIKEDMSGEKNRIGSALCLFENPQLVRQALEFSLSQHVRTQDIGRFLVVSFENKKAREVTWEFIKEHWDELLSKMEGLEMDWVVNGAASVANEALAKDIFDFFASHPHPKLEKAMRQVREQITSNLDWKKREAGAIEKFLHNKV